MQRWALNDRPGEQRTLVYLMIVPGKSVREAATVSDGTNGSSQGKSSCCRSFSKLSNV